ncbi:hypothetical protein EK21DRAFT_95336 [Setomelanomma holmii]|uniref:Uncharacterized protein n=1 Tax=Setomelanomma holmii TaxID=210430 RepID=A0A9P4GU10_9PLEO|nr:hypothetical protein EK21DRAFT_95336 [Setomelanomma holmii]
MIALSVSTGLYPALRSPASASAEEGGHPASSLCPKPTYCTASAASSSLYASTRVAIARRLDHRRPTSTPAHHPVATSKSAMARKRKAPAKRKPSSRKKRFPNLSETGEAFPRPLLEKDSALVLLTSLEPRQYCQMLLGGVTSPDADGLSDETPAEDTTSGWGIVELMADDLATWMRPTVTLVDEDCCEEAAAWATPGEYTRDERRVYNVKDTSFRRIETQVLTVEKHAVYPNLPTHPCPDATCPDVVEKTPLGSKLRFTRSEIDRDGILHARHDTCHGCHKPLLADCYVHCRGCEQVFHNRCLANSAPFRINGGALFDVRNEKVQCPKCNKDILSEKSIQSHAEFSLIVCIDIGSEKPKVSMKIQGGHETSDAWERDGGMPVSAVWIADGKVYTHKDRYAGATKVPGAVAIQPLKKALYDEACNQQLNAAGVTVESVFRCFFDTIMTTLENAHKARLTAWAKAAAQVASPVLVIVALAFPSGLPGDSQSPALTSLYHAIKMFMKNIEVAGAEIKVCNKPESEMALVGTLRNLEMPDLEPSARLAVFDAGGTTCDFTLHKPRIDTPSWQFDYLESNSCLVGVTLEADRLIKDVDVLKQSDWVNVTTWVVDAAKDSDKAREPCCATRVDAIWGPVHKEFISLRNKWIKTNCNIIKKDHTDPDAKLIVVLTGGAFMDKQTANEVTETIQKLLPKCEVLDGAYTSEMKSSVLEGLELYVESLDYTAGRSPVSIYFKTDTELNAASEASNFIVLTQASDPLQYGLVSRLQAQPGELLTLDVSWGEDNTCEVLFYAEHARAEETMSWNDLLVTKSLLEDECYTIARTRLRKPEKYTPREIYVAAWPNPLGQTIRVAVYAFEHDQSSTDMLRTSHAILQQKADDFIMQVHGLDTYKINRYTSMRGLDGILSMEHLTGAQNMITPFWTSS